MSIDKNYLTQFFDDLDQFVYISDPDTYELIYLNKKFREIARGNESDKVCYKKLYNLDAPCPYCTNRKLFGANSKSPSVWEFFNPLLKKWFHIIDQKIELNNRTLRFEIAREITKRKKVEEKLEFNSMVLNQIQDMITVTDLNGKIIYVNEASYRALKMSREDLIGKSVHFFGENPEFGATQQEIIDETLSKGSWKGIIVNYAKDGTEQVLETRTWLIKDDKYKPIGMIGISTDITKRKKIEEKLEESERRYREIVELLPDIIFEADKNLELVFVNQIGFEKFGYDSGIIPKDFKITDILVAGEEDRAKKHIKNVISGKLTKPGEYLFRKKNGEKFYGRIHARPIYRKGEIVGLRGTLTDITEKIEHRQLIEEQNLKLNELNELKTELLRRTSHELKTPLVWIKGYSNLLLELHAKELSSEIISIIEEIRRGSLKLEQLTGEILEASRLEVSNVELDFSKENLSALVDECVKEVKFLANKRNHKIIVDVQPNMIVFIEKEKIFEVISNLLTNAIKYTPSGGTITLTSSINNDYFTISVEDTGIGITEEEMPRLFTQFGKIERFGKGWDIEPGGTGLGLYIAKKIIELHGGKIWAQSKGRGKGSTFFFFLPIKNSN